MWYSIDIKIISIFMQKMRKYLFVVLLALLVMPLTAGAANQSTTISADYVNPLTKNTVEGVLVSFLNAMQAIVVTLAIVFIVIGAILYIFSSGDEGRLKLAKGAVTAAIIGLALAIAAPSFLKQIYEIIGVKETISTELVPADTLTLAEIVMNVLNFLLSVAGTLAIIALIIGGLMYLTAAGDEKQVDTGKSMFKSAVIGIAIVMAAMIIVQQVAIFFQ